MAVSKNLLLEGMSGRIGDLIVYQCNGKTYVRRMPEGEIKMSPKMLEQQERWAGVAAFYQAVKAAGLSGGWKKAAEGVAHSGYNLFMKRHQMVFSKTGEVADMSRLAVTVGRLGVPDGMRAAAREGETVELAWENGTDYPNAGAEDRLRVVLVEHDEGWRVEMPEIGDWRRKHCRATIRLPTAWAGAGQMYCFFESEEGEVSESKYLSLIN